MKKHNFMVIKGIYLCLLTAYAILREVMILQRIVGNTFVTYGFFLAGLAVIALELMLDHRPLFCKNQWLLYLFLLLCGISTMLNLQVDLLSNIKAIAWMVLYFFLLVPSGWDREGEERIWKMVMITSVGILMTLSIVALPMYFFDVGYSYIRESGFTYFQGFSPERLRLWGLYADPNTAGIYHMVAVCFVGSLCRETDKIWLRILLVLGCIPMLIVGVLGNSRTVLVAGVAAAGWIAFYLCSTCRKDKGRKRTAVSVLALVLAAVFACGSFSVAQFAMPYVKAAVQMTIGDDVKASVHEIYDRAFRWSGLNIYKGYYEHPSAHREKPEEYVQLIAVAGNIQVTQVAEAAKPMAVVTAAEIVNVTQSVQQEKSVSGETSHSEHQAPQREKLEVETIERNDLGNDISNGRFEIWRDVLTVARHNPIFGASPRGISQAAREVAPDGHVAMYNFAAHNSLLEVLAGTGVLAFSIILIILVKLAVIILRKTFTEGYVWQIAVYGTALLLMVCEMMFITDVFFNLTFGGIAFWLSSGRILECAQNAPAGGSK